MAVIEGFVSANGAEVDATNRLKVNLDTGTNPAQVGAVRVFSENDATSNYLRSPETDDDYRLRVSQETLLDCETFNYTAQSTGKHTYLTTTMVNAWSAAGMTTNSGNITTLTTGTTFGTYAMFPILGTSQLYCEIEASFTAQPTTNTIVDFGLFQRGAANPYTPADGVYFRLNSSGLLGVVNSNGTETTVSLSAFTYTNNQKYQFITTIHEREVEFWIDGVLHGIIETPLGQGQPCMSVALPFSIRHAIVGGAAGAALSFVLNDYTISLGGPQLATTPSVMGQRIYGSYQGGSGGTMGSLATYPNSTNATAAAPSNTALTANLPGGLGGQGIVTAAVAAATDGIWGSYQVPLGTANVQGRRLVVRGIRLSALNTGAAVATTATAIQFSLAFGHTAVSLATAEGAAIKAPRRVALGLMTWPIAAAIGAGPQNGDMFVDFGDAPIFVNPGEFIALVGKFILGTATASQTITFVWQPVYGWE